MYVTRPLSQLLKSAEVAAEAPPDGPNSGYLVIQDEESVTYSCFGLCKNRRLKLLPFPQDKELVVRYTTSAGDSTVVYEDPLFLIPALDKPLDSNCYYAIVPHGKHKGEAYICSREDDMTTCCFCRCKKDLKPRPLDPQNIYHQFQIAPHSVCGGPTSTFFATSIAPDGFPPSFLRRKGWTIHAKTAHNLKLDTANGLDSTLRAHLPGFDFPISQNFSEALVVGKWYSPFMFVKEGTLSEQTKSSLYYEWTLEKRWEKIFSCHNKGKGNRVEVDKVFEKEQVFVGGVKGEWEKKGSSDGVVWYTSEAGGGGKIRVGLRVEIVERMRWEERRGGWRESGGEERVCKEEEYKGVVGGWREFGLYVLVESFNLKRMMDGRLVMSCDFRHFHQLRTKWE